jgi:hypothetical protein
MHLEDVLLDLISKYFRPILNDLNKSYYNHMGIFKIEGHPSKGEITPQGAKMKLYRFYVQFF